MKDPHIEEDPAGSFRIEEGFTSREMYHNALSRLEKLSAEFERHKIEKEEKIKDLERRNRSLRQTNDFFIILMHLVIIFMILLTALILCYERGILVPGQAFWEW